MSQDELQHLISMANQINRNCHLKEPELSTEFVVTHIQQNWSRSMKQKLRQYAETDGSDLDHCAAEAARQLTFKEK